MPDLALWPCSLKWGQYCTPYSDLKWWQCSCCVYLKVKLWGKIPISDVMPWFCFRVWHMREINRQMKPTIKIPSIFLFLIFYVSPWHRSHWNLLNSCALNQFIYFPWKLSGECQDIHICVVVYLLFYLIKLASVIELCIQTAYPIYLVWVDKTECVFLFTVAPYYSSELAGGVQIWLLGTEGI